MPLNAKGEKIKANMQREYGAKKGASVFYASENSGAIKGVTKERGGGMRQAAKSYRGSEKHGNRK